MSRIAFLIEVSGVVQGVGFRYFTRQKARELGLFGEVQNQKNGTVRIVVEGAEEQLGLFIEWCHHGPDTATVEKLDYQKVEPTATTSFELIR